MIRDDETVRPVTIHLVSTGDNAAQMRRIESITAYLKDAGLSESQMRFETGLNGESYHPSAPELANWARPIRLKPAQRRRRSRRRTRRLHRAGPGYMAK
jgi:hypothetical protein